MLIFQVRWPNGNITEFRVPGDKASLGRAPDSDALLPSNLSSRNHARVYYTKGKVYVEDLESANGTFLRNEAIKLPEPVNPEDPIKLGDVFIRVAYEDEAEKPDFLKTLESGSYSIAQKLGDKKRTGIIGADAGAELKKMLQKAEEDEKNNK